MRTFLIIALVVAFAAFPALAADIFNKPVKDNALPDVPPAARQQEAPTPAPQLQQMPSPQTAPQAEKESIESFAKRYNENCLKKKNEILKGDDLRMLCACTASKLQEKMTVAEVETMTTDTPEGQVQRNRMVTDVYAPCMEYPSRALLMNQCASYQEKLKKTAGGQSINGEAICGCLAQNMAAYVALNAQPILAQKLAANPADMDPLGAFLNSQEYQAQVNATFSGCIQQHGAFKQ
jgi:hypothetical protein